MTSAGSMVNFMCYKFDARIFLAAAGATIGTMADEEA